MWFTSSSGRIELKMTLAQARSALADAEAARRLAIAELRWQYGVPVLP